MKQLSILFAVLTISIFGLNCNKTKPLEWPDPCIGITHLKADFDICEAVGDSLYKTDTIANFEVWFRAKGAYDSVVFYVGSDDRAFKSNLFKLSLNDSEVGQTISVKMKGYKKDDKCLLNQKTIDSVSKSFVVICPSKVQCSSRFNAPNDFAFVGKFNGNNLDEPNKNFTVTIVNFGYDSLGFQSLRHLVQIYNLPNGCGGKREDKTCGNGNTVSQQFLSVPGREWGFRSFVAEVGVTEGWCCSDVKMYGYIDPKDRNKITIYHRKHKAFGAPTVFVGYRQ